MIILVYSVSGVILQKVDTPIDDKGDDLVAVVPDAVGYVVTTDDTVTPQSHRINLTTMEPELKPSIPVTYAASTSVNTSVPFTGLPTCSVTYGAEGEEESLDISDGVLSFSTDLAGEYSLVFTSPLYLDTTTVITVTD